MLDYQFSHKIADIKTQNILNTLQSYNVRYATLKSGCKIP